MLRFDQSVPDFSHSDINHQQWGFGTEVPIERARTSYTGVQYDQSIVTASAPPVQFAFGLDVTDASGQTALHRVIASKDISQAKSLLERGAAVDVKDIFGNQALHCAVISEELTMVRLLLRYGADTNVAGNRSRSPLHLAIALSNEKIARHLLDEGASISSQDDNGDSALHLAISVETWREVRYYPEKSDSHPLIDILLDAKAETNIANLQGFTPFHKLLSRSYVGTEYVYINKFIEAGASAHIPLPSGIRPFEVFLAKSEFPWDEARYVKSFKNTALRSFVAHGADPTTELPSRVPLILHFISKCLLDGYFSGDPSLLDLLCKHVRIGPISRNGNTTLHQLAVTCGGYGSRRARISEAMEGLLNRGADPNRQNLEGQTPLLLLFTGISRETIKSVLKCLKTLLAHGADPMILDSNGNTALFAAAKILNSDELRSLFQTDIRLKHSSNSVHPSGSNIPSRLVWEEWEQAVRADDWADAKAHLRGSSVNIPEDVAQKLRDSAFKALAGKHVDLAKTKFQGESDAKEKRRSLVATILRECRLQNFEIDSNWMDYLLTLC